MAEKEKLWDLCDRLSEGWTGSGNTFLQALLNTLSARLGTQIEVQEDSDSFLFARIDLSMVHFRGFSDVNLVVVGGAGDHLPNIKRVRSSGDTSVLIAVALARTAHQQALAALRDSYSLVLSPVDIVEILTDQTPIEVLKNRIRDRYPKRFLMPYSRVGSAEFNMFKGRQAEIEQLWLRADSSFAVVGPSKIGKTSLLQFYHRLLKRNRDPRATATFYIDMYESAFLSWEEDRVVRFLATRIDASSRSARLELPQWDSFVRQMNGKLGQRITLLLDEVDPICGMDVLELITMTVKRGLCRVVLSGRGALARLTVDPNRNAAHRFQRLLLGPLEASAAESLLREPLEDMGFHLHTPDRLCRMVLSFSGRLPFHIQFLAERICELAFANGKDEITERDLDAVFEDHETSQLFTAPIYELADPVARLIALRLLEIEKRPITEATVSELASREGIALSLAVCRRLCDYLVIERVLIWQAGAYTIANDALIHYARRQRNRLDRLLDETRRSAKEQAHATGWDR